LKEWTGSFFVRRSLSALGLVMQLGHPAGYSCPTAHAAHELFVLIDVSGVHTVKVFFCNCDARVTHAQQLMRVRWWPATVKDPQTCASFAVVRLFQMLNCLGKVSAHDFLRSLELLTNNDGLNPVPVSEIDGSVWIKLTCSCSGSSPCVPPHCQAISHDFDDETRWARPRSNGRQWYGAGRVGSALSSLPSRRQERAHGLE
jgi:hypothetical protein